MALPHTAVRLYPVSVLYIECSPLFSKYLDIFFFFVIVHQLLRNKPSACTRIDCVSASCAGFLSLPQGRKYCQMSCKKGLRQLCKLSGLLALLCKLVFRCVTQYEQRQRKAGIDFLLLVHIKKYMVRVSSQKGK